MKFNKKRKGSSLIFVVIIFMFVLTVSVSMLSMVTNNFKARAIESKRVENIYGAESGLDVAYNVMAKTVENANRYAYEQVENFKNQVDKIQYGSLDNYKNNLDEIEKCKAYVYILKADIDYQKNINNNNIDKINDDSNNINLIINHVFRHYFKEYINGNEKEQGKLITNIQGEKIDNIQNGKYLNEENKTNYVSYNGADIKFNENSLDEENKLIWNNHKDDGTFRVSETDLVEEYHYEKETDENGEIKYKLVPTKTNIQSENYPKKISTNIYLISTFKETSNVGENERIIETQYNLIVPNYNEVTFEKTIESNTDELPGLTIGGNLIVDKSNLDVYGDIMVEGENGTFNTFNTKYNGGISIDNAGASDINMVKFHNNVFCRKTFKAMNNVSIDIDKNLYAGNIYINSINGSNNSGSFLSLCGNTDDDKVVINNDLEMNAYNTIVNIKNFYGINDINDSSNKREQVLNSSSIIVNNNDKSNRNSKLIIEKDAYIRGVAHINTNTENGYQTGESVAVKGNYNAYSVPLTPEDKFTYQDPLQLLDESILGKKSEHFYNYWNNGKLEGLDNGGVIFGGIGENLVHSIGDIVYGEVNEEGKIIGSKVLPGDDNNTNNSINNKITEQKKDFAKNIYCLNIQEENKKKINGKDPEYSTYEKEEDIENIRDIVNENINLNDLDNIKYIKTENNEEFRISNVGKFEGIYIVDGNLTVDKDYEIDGNLIVLGNLKIENGAKLTLKYDRELTRKIQNENLLVIKTIFKGNYGKDKNIISNGYGTYDTESNPTDFIKTKSWKIVK